jgi:hypothetical protein
VFGPAEARAVRSSAWSALAGVGGLLPLGRVLSEPGLGSRLSVPVALALVGGTLVLMVGPFGAVGSAGRMYRHRGLLKAYGIGLDAWCEEEDRRPVFY